MGLKTINIKSNNWIFGGTEIITGIELGNETYIVSELGNEIQGHDIPCSIMVFCSK